MKTVKKSLVAVFMLVTLISYAKGNRISSINAKEVKVEFNTVKKGNIFSIQDENGILIYNNTIEFSGEYSKTFDLSALENGRYTAELNADFEIIIKPFFVENGLVTFLIKNEKTIFKPLIRTQNNLILISKIAFDKQPIKIILYYDDEVIHSEIAKDEEILNRVYRLNENEKGDYKVVLKSNRKTFIQRFKL